MTIDNLIKSGCKILKEHSILSYHIDSELLLSKVLGKNRSFLLTNGKLKVPSKEVENYFKIISINLSKKEFLV